MNKVILVGNLGADAEVRATSSGVKVATLRLATNERKKGDDGQWVDHTEWHKVVCFGSTAEFAGRNARKGRQFLVEGKLSTRKYTDREGVERYSTEVLAETIRPLGGGGSSESTQTSRPPLVKTGVDEDIPF